MNASTAAAATQAALIGTIVAIVLTIAWYVLLVIAYWKIFKKAGEPGWKAIIPFYNMYIQIKFSWKTTFFWVMLILAILSIIFTACAAAVPLLGFFGIGLYVALIVFVIISWYRLSKSFGHAGGWTVGLVLLQPIFMLMLGFGKSQYQGNVYLREQGN